MAINWEKKQVYKTYKKLLSKYNKWAFNFSELSIDYFIIYLKYLRDIKLLDTPVKEIENNSAITTLTAALDTYSLYINCINNYYTVSSNMIERKDLNKSASDVQQEYIREKTMHLNAFWEIVKTNIGSWIY